MEMQDIGCLIKQINDRLKISADESLRDSGLTMSQARVMGYLQMKKGKATQKEIETYLNVSHPTVVGIVSRLEKTGFVNCHFDPKDRRNKIVCVTDKAAVKSDEMDAGRAEVERRLLQSLSEAEISELRRLLQILYHNVE